VTVKLFLSDKLLAQTISSHYLLLEKRATPTTVAVQILLRVFLLLAALLELVSKLNKANLVMTPLLVAVISLYALITLVTC